MAISSAISEHKLHIEAVQTVVPTKPTDPRQSLRVLIPHDHLSSSLFQRRFHILLCYNKAFDEDSGWLVAGRIKESLGRALQEYPLLAGRLRQGGESGVDLEIVSNDSGVRLVEGRVEIKLAEYLELKEKGEGELVFWEDVLAHSPQFCPLFYVQVTNFSCGGYSIGISCSLLLVDPFVLTTFLKNWANLHNTMLSTTHMPKIPTFYLPNLGKLGTNPTLFMGSNTPKNAAETLIFKIPTTKTLHLDSNIYRNLAELCVDEAERHVGRKMATTFALFLKVQSSDDATVDFCSRQGLLESPLSNIDGLTCATTWDELGLDDVCFNKGKKPFYASCWINSVSDEGSVMIIPSSDVSTLGMRILVTFN